MSIFLHTPKKNQILYTFFPLQQKTLKKKIQSKILMYKKIMSTRLH